MYKKITCNDKKTRYISKNHYTDNYITKDITENVSLAIANVSEEIKKESIANERIYYFLSADVDFIIDGEKVHFQTGDILYAKNIKDYSAKGKFEAIIINAPAYGVIKEV